ANRKQSEPGKPMIFGRDRPITRLTRVILESAWDFGREKTEQCCPNHCSAHPAAYRSKAVPNAWMRQVVQKFRIIIRLDGRGLSCYFAEAVFSLPRSMQYSRTEERMRSLPSTMAGVARHMSSSVSGLVYSTSKSLSAGITKVVPSSLRQKILP